MDNSQVIPMCNITSTKLTQYYYYTDCRRKREVSDKSMQNLKDNKVKGKYSYKSSKNLTKIVNNWYSCVYFDMIEKNEDVKKINKRFSFVTLTLSSQQEHDDKYIKRNMLGAFIQEIKRKESIINYLHCSEAQQNGNIHFHIILDKYIHHKTIRDIWNNIQDNHGYLDKFEIKHNHRNPNSTDVHALNKIHNIPAYLVKYFTKDEKRRHIEGRLWGCSDNLRQIECYNDAIDNETDEFLLNLKNDTACRKYYGDYWSIWEYRHMINYLDTSSSFINRVKAHYLEQSHVLSGKTTQKQLAAQRNFNAPKVAPKITLAPQVANPQKKVTPRKQLSLFQSLY